MKFLFIVLLRFMCILIYGKSDSESISWDKLATSKIYENTRLVMETENPFQSLNISKEYSISMTRIQCSKLCVNDEKCLGFNLYSTNSHYVCEFLPENFCSKRQRIALQVWPGGTVWDKLNPGRTKACIDQEFANKTGAELCETGRSGCRSAITNSSQLWPDCNNCVRSCVDCYSLYNPSADSQYNCTLWPDRSSGSPIFTTCYERATFLVKKNVNLSTGYVWPNYRMSFRDMNRLSELNVYKILNLFFRYDTSSTYRADYQNFYIDENGTLMNMTLAPGQTDDGLNVGNQILKASPWIETESDCGSFWLLNSTQSSSSLECPGGGIRMFGKVNIKNGQTGIRWPKATKENKTLFYASLRMVP